MKRILPIVTTIVALCISVAGVAVPKAYSKEDVAHITAAADGDTLAFEFVQTPSLIRPHAIVCGDTVIQGSFGFHYYPKETKKPYYAVIQKDDKHIVSYIYNRKTGELIEVAQFGYQTSDALVLNGKQALYANGKEFYQEFYVNDILRATIYVDTLGRPQTTFNLQAVDWKYYSGHKSISMPRDASYYRLTQKMVYYASGSIKSQTDYDCDVEGNAVLSTVYFDERGKKQTHKASNAVKMAQKYLDAHFDYPPIESDLNDIVRLTVLIPVVIYVDTTGVITSVSLTGKVTYSAEIVSGYVIEHTLVGTGVTTDSNKTSYGDNKEIEKRIQTYTNNVAEALRGFIKQMSEEHLQGTPELIGKVPQSAVIKANLERDGLKVYKIK